VWDAATRREFRSIRAFVALGKDNSSYGEVTDLALSRDGNRIFAFAKDENRRYLPALRVFDTASGEELLRFADPPVSVTNLAVSPDGCYVAAAVAGEVGEVYVWDAATGEIVRKWLAHAGGTRWVAYRPDGRELATAGADGTICTWDAGTGRELLRLRSQAGTLYTVAYHPNGSRLASGGDDGTVQVWDLESGHEVLVLRGHWGMVAGLAFSPNGRRLVAMTMYGKVTIWDATPLSQ
jgi:DNA-binding beta-propeller fold protein YncE